MNRKLLAACLVAFASPVWAQSVPATNFTDMWWGGPSESGWGVSFAQHSATNRAYAVWYTYDPRAGEGADRFKPLWIVMPGGTWSSPTRYTGPVYVTTGVPFSQAGSNTSVTQVGTFTFDFSNASNGTFTYNIAAPTGLPSTDPAFGLPGMAGSKAITRQSF
jgi:hypothetical protein